MPREAKAKIAADRNELLQAIKGFIKDWIDMKDEIFSQEGCKCSKCNLIRTFKKHEEKIQ